MCDLVNTFNKIYLNLRIYAWFVLHLKGSSIALIDQPEKKRKKKKTYKKKEVKHLENP